jgi:hypothetical protein
MILKIDNVQVPLPGPTPFEEVINIVVRESPQGDRNVTLTGDKKRDFDVQYKEVFKADYETYFMPYINKGFEYLVEIIEEGVTLFKEYCFLRVKKVDKKLNNIYGFTVEIIQL